MVDMIAEKGIVFTGYLSYDVENHIFPTPIAPRGNTQLTLLGRDITSGGVYVLWYNVVKQGFLVSVNLNGFAPHEGSVVWVQY